MGEDRPLELSQRCGRLESELADEQLPREAVLLKSLGLAARAAQSEHQLPSQTLAERLLGDERHELGAKSIVPAERELGIDRRLDSVEPQLLEPFYLPLSEARRIELAERPAAPQRLSPPQRPDGLAQVAVFKPRSSVGDEPLEYREIELILVDPQDVAS